MNFVIIMIIPLTEINLLDTKPGGKDKTEHTKTQKGQIAVEKGDNGPRRWHFKGFTGVEFKTSYHKFPENVTFFLNLM